MYKIKVHYTTGDSFHTEETYTVIELGWQNLDIAKENLKRIKKHYEIEQAYNKIYYDKKSQDDFAKNLPEYIKIEKRHHLLCMTLKADNGNEMQFYPCWCGFFERLHGAEIIVSQDNDMQFTI